MCAMPPESGSKADFGGGPSRDHRDVVHRKQRAALFDDLVGKCKDRIRDVQPDRLRGLEIEGHFELRGLLHG